MALGIGSVLVAVTAAANAGVAEDKAGLTAGFNRALLACAIFLLAAAVISLRATNTRGESAARTGSTHAARGQVPAPEPAD